MYYSTKTTNKSFIDMWRYLQRNNIENNLFMLQTHSKDLVDFSIEKYKNMDREDPNFLIYRSKVIEEAKNNIWFYFRELVVVPDGNGEYKPFELNTGSMMMIYLYDKGKSFINSDLNNSLTLQFIWDRHRSLYCNDIVLVNSLKSIIEISNNIKNHIAHSKCDVLFGSTMIMSDDINRFIVSDIEAFKYYQKKSTKENLFFIDTIKSRINSPSLFDIRLGLDHTIFILEDDVSHLAYAQLDITNFRVCLNTLNNKAIGHKIIYNGYQYHKKATNDVYDTKDDDLNSFYVI